MENSAMKEENKFIKAVTKLIELTQEGSVRWTVSRDNRNIIQGTENVVELSYTTTYEGQRLRLYELKYKDYFDQDQYVWATTVVLEMIDNEENTVWSFPYNRAIADLLEAAQYQTAGVDEFINRLLSNPKNKPS